MIRTFTGRTRSQDQDPTCNITRHSTSWMPNDQGQDPCELVGLAMQTCNQGDNASRFGVVPNNLKCPGDPKSPCCCSTATYALLSACWVCQGNKHKDINNKIKTPYDIFFRDCPNPTDIPAVAPPMGGLNLPPWAKIQPSNLSNHWDFDGAQQNALAFASVSTVNSVSTASSIGDPQPTTTESGASATNTQSSSTSSKSSMPAGTIAASVVGSLAAVALLCLSGCLFWRWRRRRRVIQAEWGTKVDLTEPETYEAPPPLRTPQRAATFPYPFESVVPRHHADAPNSYNPSHSDVPDLPASAPAPTASNRRLKAPSGDQLMSDLARLGDSAPRQKIKSPWRRQVPASSSTFTHSENSGSSSSRRTTRQTDGQGRYFHLPPSAQYLAEVARYPENVDPERPWNIRRPE